MPRPRRSCRPVKVRALRGVRAARARGLRRVRRTCGSRLRSQRSLMVQPALRITRAPVRKRRVWGSGVGGEGRVWMAAVRVEKRQGRKR